MKASISQIVLLLLIGRTIHAQETFQKYYETGGIGSFGLNIHQLDSTNMMLGVSYLSGISIIDPTGEIIYSHGYDIDPFWILQSVDQISLNEYVFTGGIGPINGDLNPLIGRMDSLGNVISASYYDLTDPTINTFAAGDIVITADQGTLVSSRPVDSDFRFFLLKIDSMGDPVWCKDYGFVGSPHFLEELPSGDLLVGLTMSSGGAAVGRMDPDGNFLWLRSYIRPNGAMRDCQVENDSSFTVLGYTHTDNGPGTKLFMMRLNGNGDVQWCKGYDTPLGWFTPRAKIDRTADGQYVVMGRINTPNDGEVYLMKVDLNGDTLWTRSLGVGIGFYSLGDLRVNTDGGIMMSGTYYDQSLGTLPYLWKADSLGHLPCPEHEHWYPVQVQDLFPFDSSFTLTAIDGAIRYPATVNDTIYPPVVTIDGCTITEVPSYTSRPPRPRVRPNPNTGRFTVDFTDPLQRDSYYSVFDATGRLLFQRPLAPGATQQDIDLSRFGRGTYILHFTTPEGVSQERVVVE